MPKSDTVAKNTKTFLVNNNLKFEKVYLEILFLLLGDFDNVKFCIEANFKTSLLDAFCSSSSAINCLLK